ncbi:MAG: hypothetical protein JO094_11170, partial [Hyphomicrobiales bacterium]|nr:hypothetical protein [Hyphomicrobiales bacterium]
MPGEAQRHDRSDEKNTGGGDLSKIPQRPVDQAAHNRATKDKRKTDAHSAEMGEGGGQKLVG